jgi:aminomethyltransferase
MAALRPIRLLERRMAAGGDTPLNLVPLDALHRRLGARMGAFAGYDMPIQYPDGVMAEHLWTRKHCGLFDVSHMGPGFLTLPGGPRTGGDELHAPLAALMERLVPSDIGALTPGKIQLTVLLNAEGGVLDDLMIGRPADPDRQGILYIVVNAATKHEDWALIRQTVGDAAVMTPADDRALLALQGQEAEAVLLALVPGVDALTFMTFQRVATADFGDLVIARCGYTGEDGFEILVKPQHAEDFAARLLADARVKPIGLGARDSLRLEAGLCLYGHDLDSRISPVGGGLTWMVSKSRRARADFPGAARILGELANGARSKRVGIRPTGRQPAREGAEIQTPDGRAIGVVTSGGFAPTLNAPVSMGYVEAAHAKPGTPVHLIVRGKALEAEIVPLPFVPTRYKR